MDQFVGRWVMETRLSPKIISGMGMCSRDSSAEMGPALEMGSLRERMVKLPWVWVLVAEERSGGGGCVPFGRAGDAILR